jgi:hypothetical protein
MLTLCRVQPEFNMAQQEEEDLRDCLCEIGWSVGQADAIVAEGFDSMEELGEMLLKDVSSVCTIISKLPNNRGGIRIGHNLVRRLKGLVWWIRDHQRHDQVANEVDWDLDTCKEAIEHVDMLEESRAANESKIEAPGKLNDGDWVQ